MNLDQSVRERALDELLETAKGIQRNIMPKWQQYAIQGFVVFLLLCAICLLVYTVRNPDTDFTLNLFSAINER